MAKKEKKKLTANEILVGKTEGWIATHKSWIIGAVAVIVAAILVAVIITVVSGKGSDSVSTALVTLQSDYEAYEVMDSDDEGYADALANVKAEAEALVASPGVKKYEGAKAALVLAEISYNDGDYASAVDYYNTVYEAQKNTYLGQVALMGKAASLEESGDEDGALEVYNYVYDTYGVGGIYASRALFNAARLTEKSNVALAISMYEQLAGEFEEAGSEFAKLATSRAAQLKLSN